MPANPEIRQARRLAALWLLLAALLLLAFLAFGQKLRIDTQILHLLPQQQQNPLIIRARQQLDSQLQQTVVWLAGGDSEQQALQQAQQLQQRLQQSGLFATLQLQWQPQQAGQPGLLQAHRYFLLNQDDRQAISDDAGAFAQKRLQMLYSPLGMQYAASLAQDPFFTLGSYLNQLYASDIELYQDVIMLRQQQRYFAVLISTVASQGFAAQQALAALHQQLSADDTQLLAAGLPLYSAYGARSAEAEISTVGVFSVLAIIVLMLVVFASLRPLLLTLFSIASGVTAAVLVTSMVHGQLHVITLVFGSSLIGITVDYSFHYFCDRLRAGQQSALTSLRAILPGISLGLISSMIAYGILLFTPFPGLQQIGLFSLVGLLSAWLCVVLLYPWLAASAGAGRQVPMAALLLVYQQAWPAFCRRWRWPLGIIVLIWLVGGFYRLSFNDDIRAMQQPEATLLAQEQQIAAIGRQRPDGQFLLVSAADTDQWWQAEQTMLAALAPLRDQGQLGSWQAISELYPATELQLHDYQLLQQQLFASGLLQHSMQQLHMPQAQIDQLLQDFAAQQGQPLSLELWLQAAPQQLGSLWLGCQQGLCSSMIRLYNMKGTQALAEVQALADSHAAVQLVDPVADINHLLAQYRHYAGLFLLLALLGIGLFLALVLGMRAAVRIVLVPLLALMLALASMSLAGFSISMFHLFGLLLALGISLDYAIFHYVGKHPLTVTLAVALSLLTSLLAFGLLASSSTAFIQAFGLSLAGGIVYAFALAPLASNHRLSGENNDD